MIPTPRFVATQRDALLNAFREDTEIISGLLDAGAALMLTDVDQLIIHVPPRISRLTLATLSARLPLLYGAVRVSWYHRDPEGRADGSLTAIVLFEWAMVNQIPPPDEPPGDAPPLDAAALACFAVGQ